MEEEDTHGIRAALLIEVMGKPREALIEALEEIVSNLAKEKGVSVISQRISDPCLVENQKEVYTSFADIELKVNDLINLAIIIFKYMPANVEIISPELIALTNNSWSDIFSEIVRRLHKYEEITRMVQFEKDILERKLRATLQVTGSQGISGNRGNTLPVTLTSGKKAEEKKEKVEVKKEKPISAKKKGKKK